MTHRARLTLAATAAVLVAALGLAAQGPGGGRGGGGGGGGRGQASLPDGPGRDTVLARCSVCHQVNQIVGSTGYDREGWQSLVSTMVDLPAAEESVVLDYLAAHFPPTTDREPTLVPGPVEVTFREWLVPTLGQRPRDPLQLEDGTIWWAGMYGSLIGRLNPETGEMREFRLNAEARPHSIINGPDGHIWYMGNGNGTIGRLDPATGAIAVYEMPDPDARDPHTGIFAADRTLWFTAQQSGMIGRMNITTGDIELARTPTANGRPYGIVIDSKGTPWVAYNGSNRIAKIDPETMTITEYPTPTPESRIRRLALLSDDTIFYVDSARGYLGRMNPATGEITEWPSPSGPASHPYAIAVVDDIVWYNESNQRPDALVRFDPETERFQSWAVPSGVGIIRNMRVSPDGNLVIHQSSSNRVGLVIID